MKKKCFVSLIMMLFVVAGIKAQTTDSTSIYQFAIPGANGGSIQFSAWAGKKILIVNTASLANNKSQIAKLQTLQQNNVQRLVVVAIPCDDFNNLEPEDSASVILQNYQQQFGVMYPVSIKLHTTGTAIHSLYRFLMEQSLNGRMQGKVKENFRKFLVDEEGHLLASFSGSIDPLDAMIQEAIEH